jgi:CBS domain-containing protein
MLVVAMSGVILVRDVMAKTVKTVTTDSSLQAAVQKMNKFNIGSVVVMDPKRNRCIGIVTERDVLKTVQSYSEPMIVSIKQIMSHPLVTVDVDTSIEEAARIMAKNNIKRLPVMKDDKIAGIITSSDIMRASPMLVNTFLDLLRSKSS